MPGVCSVATCISSIYLLLSTVNADSFLKHQHTVRTVSLKARSEELQAALGAVYGCSSGQDTEAMSLRTPAIRDSVLPVWKSLPQTEGRVEWRLVRHLVHRHFMHYGILVRGLEPNIQVNSSNSGDAEILGQIPALAQQMRGSKSQRGFLLDDVIAMVAALEHLIFNSESTMVEQLYREKGLDVHQRVSTKQMMSFMRAYIVHWLVGGEDEDLAKQALQHPTALPEMIPHWKAVEAMVQGSVMALNHRRSPGHLVFSAGFTFEDALQISGEITRNFAHFWEFQCQSMKEPLVEMDKHNTGRVRLADFYGANKAGEWRYGESESYLRELGALDESSAWIGKQVIISNYLQAASNCIAARPHYLVCCLNECEDILGQVEGALKAPVASVEDVLRVVEEITNGDDERAKLTKDLRRQLVSIGAPYGGSVPLHGRLFAQWLHYAFPRECPFPHKSGSAATVTPNQFGDDFAVKTEDVDRHIADDVVAKDLGNSSNSTATQDWMTQWSEEEELLADYPMQAGSFQSGRYFALGGAAAAAAALLFIAGKGGSPASHTFGSSLAEKSHFV